jgi:hypothetical protein
MLASRCGIAALTCKEQERFNEGCQLPGNPILRGKKEGMTQKRVTYQP